MKAIIIINHKAKPLLRHAGVSASNAPLLSSMGARQLRPPQLNTVYTRLSHIVEEGILWASANNVPTYNTYTARSKHSWKHVCPLVQLDCCQDIHGVHTQWTPGRPPLFWPQNTGILHGMDSHRKALIICVSLKPKPHDVHHYTSSFLCNILVELQHLVL